MMDINDLGIDGLIDAGYGLEDVYAIIKARKRGIRHKVCGECGTTIPIMPENPDSRNGGNDSGH